MTQALVATGPNARLEVMEIELRPLTPVDVRVRIAGVGVCHSDLSMVNGTLSPSYPLVLGHEAAGVVAEVGDEVTDRFCVLGSPQDHIRKLRELAAAGVDQFNIYLMNGNEEEQLEVYGGEIIPAMRDATAMASDGRAAR
jgi:alkanesulfonate monooxygenase SsuD/methylene tetrahydromethanopterin reductase-like flavin-dependent oxidoreductase (luciferase family)